MAERVRVFECASWQAAFELNEKEHIALVGGGGKTTTLWSLARELQQKRTTVATATTKAGPPPPDIPLVLWHDGMDNTELVAALEVARRTATEARTHGSLIALGNAARPDRLQSVASAALDFIFTDWNANVINEADGARMKPFKAPAAHEPVLATTTTLAIVVIGADAVGLAIHQENLHRAELIASITGAKIGEPLTYAHLQAILTVYIQRMTEQAPGARYAVLINKADDGPEKIAVELAPCLAALPLSAIVAATQRGFTKRWRLR